MIRKFFKSAAAAAVIAAAFMTASCTKDNTPGSGSQNGDQTGVTAEVLGTYDFDGQEYRILTAAMEEDESTYSFIFSPIAPGNTVSTYLYFAVRKYWADGEEHKVGTIDLDHNDDYIIAYEDPVHLYSPFREPQEGTFTVIAPDSSDGVFHIVLDIKLADGTPLSIDYNGTFDPDLLK